MQKRYAKATRILTAHYFLPQIFNPFVSENKLIQFKIKVKLSVTQMKKAIQGKGVT